MSGSLKQALAKVDCEVRFDSLTRQLYATDASIYQIEPCAVAFPRSAKQAAALIRAAAEAGASITPRGAGTGLAGGAVGDGVIVDLARHTRQITELDLERRTVRVGPGVILDQLNAFLAPHGLCFGPDVATSSRATLGGMIASNSSGARAPVYGTTLDHVVALELVLPDGRIATVGKGRDALPEQRAAVDALVTSHAEAIRRVFHEDLVKRWPGYGVDRYLRERGDLAKLIGGSEGTLAAVTSAVLSLAPLPREKGLGLVFFATIDEAMQASVELLDLKPAAVEHIDRVLLDQTKGHLAFQAARDLLRLDDEPCESFLIVEFFEHEHFAPRTAHSIQERLAALAQRKIGLRRQTCVDPHEMDLVWDLRKAGLSLLTSRKGPAKPIGGLEDVCVRPADLPEYVKRLEETVKRLGLEASFYGHAASGLVHVRPIVDLHRAEDIAKYRRLAEAASALAKEFEGSFAAEHGVGIARTEFMEAHLGPELMTVMRGIKAAFDPNNRMNPGKIIGDGRFRIDADLRQGAGHRIPLPFEPVLAYAKRDGSFIDHLEQCNGCGDCRKDPPTMCPTFAATGDEIMVTRGRANTIRAALEGRLQHNHLPLRTSHFALRTSHSIDVLTLASLDEALSNCLSCKACQKECPSNVDMGLLKSELVHARHEVEGVSLRERLFSRVDVLGALGCMTPTVANAFLQASWFRAVMERTLGISAKRPLPLYAGQPFHRWFANRRRPHAGARGRVFLWDDCFVRYYEPNIGKAATKVLEAAGYEVVLPGGRACCGRPAFSMGRLDVAARFGQRNVELFVNRGGNEPVIFLEASCYSMFVQDYRELRVTNAERVAERCVLFEQFMFDLLEKEPDALTFVRNGPMKTAIHGHCHAKAVIDVSIMGKLAERLPGNEVQVLDSGCCGMAGAFGAMASKYELSLAVAEPLVAMIDRLDPGTRVVASGTSCRHQIGHLTEASPMHMAELLAQALPDNAPHT